MFLSKKYQYERYLPNICSNDQTFEAKVKSLLPVFGLTNNIVSGTIYAKTIYIPHGMFCHNSHLTSIQQVHAIYQKYIYRKVRKSNLVLSPTILIIKRSTRSINHLDTFISLVKNKTKNKKNDSRNI